MKTVDRVLRAYERKHKLTEDQARVIRAELSKFIEELLAGQQLPFTWSERGER
jgi:hypothetical protein